MPAFTTKSGRVVQLKSLTGSKQVAAAKKAVQKRKLKRRMTRFTTRPSAELYPIARGYYGISRSPRVVTHAGRPIKKGELAKKRTTEAFIRALKKDPSMAATFFSGMYSKK